MANRDTTVVVRFNRLDEVQSRFPKYIDGVLKAGAHEIKAKADARKPNKIPSSVQNESKGYLVAFGSRQFFFGPFVEFGTIFQAPRPFVTPAAESVFPHIRTALRNLEKLL